MWSVLMLRNETLLNPKEKPQKKKHAMWRSWARGSASICHLRGAISVKGKKEGCYGALLQSPKDPLLTGGECRWLREREARAPGGFVIAFRSLCQGGRSSRQPWPREYLHGGPPPPRAGVQEPSAPALCGLRYFPMGLCTRDPRLLGHRDPTGEPSGPAVRGEAPAKSACRSQEAWEGGPSFRQRSSLVSAAWSGGRHLFSWGSRGQATEQRPSSGSLLPEGTLLSPLSVTLASDPLCSPWKATSQEPSPPPPPPGEVLKVCLGPGLVKGQEVSPRLLPRGKAPPQHSYPPPLPDLLGAARPAVPILTLLHACAPPFSVCPAPPRVPAAPCTQIPTLTCTHNPPPLPHR